MVHAVLVSAVVVGEILAQTDGNLICVAVFKVFETVGAVCLVALTELRLELGAKHLVPGV